MTAEHQQRELGKGYSPTYYHEPSKRRQPVEKAAMFSSLEWLQLSSWGSDCGPQTHNTQPSPPPHQRSCVLRLVSLVTSWAGTPRKKRSRENAGGVGCTLYQANTPLASAKSPSAIQRTGSVGSNVKAVFAWLKERLRVTVHYISNKCQQLKTGFNF